MEEPPRAVYLAKCVYCGNSTFIDLLDGDKRCEYCREARRTQAHVLSKKKAKGKNVTERTVPVHRARQQLSG